MDAARIKELLQRLIDQGVQVVKLDEDEPDYAKEIEVVRAKMAEIPDPKDSAAVVKYVLGSIREVAKSMATNARRRELELELALLDKPDEVDLEVEEHAQRRRKIEVAQLSIEAMKREATTLATFAELASAILTKKPRAV